MHISFYSEGDSFAYVVSNISKNVTLFNTEDTCLKFTSKRIVKMNTALRFSLVNSIKKSYCLK